MSKIKLIEINKLQPTQINLNQDYILELQRTNSYKPIEVISYSGKIYISDGHHTLFAQQNKNQVATNFNDFDKAKPAYQEQHIDLIQEILKSAQKAQQQGITHISQLKLI